MAGTFQQGRGARRPGLHSIEMLVSVEGASVWKPHPGSHGYALASCDVAADETMLVAVSSLGHRRCRPGRAPHRMVEPEPGSLPVVLQRSRSRGCGPGRARAEVALTAAIDQAAGAARPSRSVCTWWLKRGSLPTSALRHSRSAVGCRSCIEASDTETHFTCGYDPEPRARRRCSRASAIL